MVPKTEEIALAVRAKMEYIEVAVPFPLRLIALIVGKKGKTIRDIQTKVRLFVTVLLGFYCFGLSRRSIVSI